MILCVATSLALLLSRLRRLSRCRLKTCNQFEWNTHRINDENKSTTENYTFYHLISIRFVRNSHTLESIFPIVSVKCVSLSKPLIKVDVRLHSKTHSMLHGYLVERCERIRNFSTGLVRTLIFHCNLSHKHSLHKH